MRSLSGLIAMILLVVACNQSKAPLPPASASPAGAASVASTAPSASARPVSPSVALASPRLDRIKLRLDPIVDGLESPLFATGAGDGSGRIFVLEQAGRIQIVRNGRLLPSPFLDISAKVGSGGERGLLGLAFRSNDEAGRRFDVDYTDKQGDTVVSEFRAQSCCPDQADPRSERVLLHINQPFANHNGGGIAFGPDGLLFMGMGDGGSEGDPMGTGQRLDTLLGKLLRIGVDPADQRAYSRPADNAQRRLPAALPEIWASGLRNPWRFSFDRSTGDLWIGDVGQNRWEEIDRVAAGAGAGLNFGWNVMEASQCYKPAAGCDQDGLTLPVAEYGHDQGCSVIGGYVYRGRASAALQGVYLFGDYCSGTIWGLDASTSGHQDTTTLLETAHTISSFGQDDDGELYVTDLSSGELLHITATAP